MELQTKTSRKHDNSFRAETIIDLGFDRREMQISTCKGISKPGIQSQAKVVQRHEDGKGFTYVIGVGQSGDFYSFLDRDVTVRCTEKTIMAMHQRSLEQADALVSQATAHYKGGQA